MAFLAMALVFVMGVLGDDTADRLTWEDWKLKFKRSYATPEEETKRFSIFKFKLRDYENRTKHDTAVYGPGLYSDLTREEFKALFRGVRGTRPEDCLQSGKNSSMTPDEIKAILEENGDDTIDWRTKGAVTPVKNQGQYGTCWSFGATGTMEGMTVATGKLPLQSISEQELIDCSPCGGYVGCCLSWYVSKTQGHANLESAYPYHGRSGSCKKDSSAIAKVTIKDRICEANGPKNNQDNVLANLMKYGPGACLIDAGCIEGYHSGIISNCPKKAGDIDHATLFVGAGTDNGVPYWIVKNSWGSSFGDGGYYKMKRNTDPPQAGVPGGIFAISA